MYHLMQWRRGERSGKARYQTENSAVEDNSEGDGGGDSRGYTDK